MSAWTCRQLSARPPLRSFHLVFEPHDGRALAPIPKRSTSPRVTSAPPVVDSLKALDPNRPIREADISGSGLLPRKPNLDQLDHKCDRGPGRDDIHVTVAPDRPEPVTCR
jgi:hypothetical protein